MTPAQQADALEGISESNESSSGGTPDTMTFNSPAEYQAYMRQWRAAKKGAA